MLARLVLYLVSSHHIHLLAKCRIDSCLLVTVYIPCINFAFTDHAVNGRKIIKLINPVKDTSAIVVETLSRLGPVHEMVGILISGWDDHPVDVERLNSMNGAVNDGVDVDGSVGDGIDPSLVLPNTWDASITTHGRNDWIEK